MKTLPTGFPVALCNTTIQSCDRRCNRSFLFLRIIDPVVDAVGVVDVSVSEIVVSPPAEHLAFSSTTYIPGITVASLIFLLHEVFLSFLKCCRNVKLGNFLLESRSNDQQRTT